MAENVKRPWFQYHLSTAILVMLAVGAIEGANMCKHIEHVFSQESYAYGWPGPFYVQADLVRNPRAWVLNPVALAVDVVFWLVALFILVYVSESSCKVKTQSLRRCHLLTYIALALTTALLLWANLHSSDEWPRGWPSELPSGSYNPKYEWEWAKIYLHHVSGNIVTGIIILFFVGCFCERCLRKAKRCGKDAGDQS